MTSQGRIRTKSGVRYKGAVESGGHSLRERENQASRSEKKRSVGNRHIDAIGGAILVRL